MPKRVVVVILNWNGWQDTIECLESVMRTDYPDFQMAVCDNGSKDASVERIMEWAEGRLGAPSSKANPLRRLFQPPVAKPIPYAVYDRTEAEQGGDQSNDARLVIIKNGDNLGFAGGNNVGLRYGLAGSDADYFWLLNNDTLVEPDALSKMVERMKARPDAGMCGATIRSYAKPDTNVVLGGAVYHKWLATQKLIGAMTPAECPIDAETVEKKMTYVAGACILVSRQFLADVGLMSEDYFLYYEELDWAIRACGKHSLAYSPESIIYHKEGAAIGSSDKPLARSRTADYYEILNRLVVTRKYFRSALPTVYIGLVLTTLNRIRRGQWDRAKMIVNIVLGTHKDYDG